MSLRSASCIRSFPRALKFNSLLTSSYHSNMIQQSRGFLSSLDPEQIIAVDCEYVGTGPKGSVSALGI